MRWPVHLYCDFLTEVYFLEGVSKTLSDLFEPQAPSGGIVWTCQRDSNGLFNTGDPPSAPVSGDSWPIGTAAVLSSLNTLLVDRGLTIVLYYKPTITMLGAAVTWSLSLVNPSSFDGINVSHDTQNTDPTRPLGFEINDGTVDTTYTEMVANNDDAHQFALKYDPVNHVYGWSLDGEDVVTGATLAEFVETLSYFSIVPTPFYWMVHWKYLAVYDGDIPSDMLPGLATLAALPPMEIVSVDLVGVSSFAAPGYTNHVRMTRSYTDGF